MEYNFNEIERKWRKYWADHKTFAAEDNSVKPKYYVLDMFPYPSGAGLHVGHPLGYIASDIYARYKRLRGYNVLHPMGYDSFGLPAEQYAIQTGQHPAITTEQNIARYRDQLDKIGFSFDWDREVRTSSPEYYKWTQWIFKQIFNSWYNVTTDKAESIDLLIAEFEKNGNSDVKAVSDFTNTFTAEEWKNYSEKEQSDILMEYRLAYLADSWVNWCPALGTVLANDEVINGLSERGGHPVEQKLMRQWSMRIKAYAERLLTGLDTVDWTDAIKDMQRNWIGKSVGASVKFRIQNDEFREIEVFTTRPDTIFGVSFMVLAPEHPLVDEITTAEYKEAIEAYKTAASLKSERDRQADVKNITGQFTGAYAIHPFSGEKIPVWIGDYVLASYGTGAVMAVPCGDQRDWDFAKHFNIPIKNIFENVDISEGAYAEKEGTIADSDFLSGLPIKKAMAVAIAKIEEQDLGKGKTNYRLRDAIFSRQRYWGEPFPVYYKNDIPYLVDDANLPIELPEVDKYLPTEDGEPPLARAEKSAWKYSEGDRMEYNTMPGWAGSSFYFLRYMDPHNTHEFVSKEKADYWNQVDLYIGGSEHATGHLLYSRFWCKFLFDKGFIGFDEPFKKMINQGMILGRSSLAYRIDFKEIDLKHPIFISSGWINKLNKSEDQFDVFQEMNSHITKSVGIEMDKVSEFQKIPVHVDISLVDNDKLDTEAFKAWRPDFTNAEFILEDDGTFICESEVEKMSKSKFNVQTPDELVEKFGADTLRMYEMFLGPLEQTKPWDTKGISGVHNFLRKLWRLFFEDGKLIVTEGSVDKASLKTLHKTIKKVEDDLERYSFNTNVSTLMICVNELTEQKCHSKEVLEQLVVLLAPYAPHTAEELWEAIGYEKGTVSTAHFPTFDPEMLVEANTVYPVSFNGKMRFNAELPTTFTAKEVEEAVLAMPEAEKWLEGKAPKKVIVVPGKIVNMVV
ncbi:leucine--tRNA ligase [Fluviicola taffensis]|uniref:Leucine--tRNA ligase n=1 Tax=Fluviicola taffensis (strain DSM 16823 / NCIMB 13979 / RW262) TaxID=755732 RepID=F2IHH3_FLUTR|nr:class I tRNA ligase family protein [Fluviicola taffensis]AEA43738.1 leucyl-tRNA synthetase [Fluviicola taffensis DSM 16823]